MEGDNMNTGIKRKILAVLSIIIFSMLVTTVVSVRAETGSSYLSRYKKLEKKCKKKFKYNGSQQEMNYESAEEYKLWDKELNYVYKDIYNKLTESNQKELKKSELAWIKKRDKKAEKSASEVKGGSMYPLLYNGAMTKLTKQRIKWLIKKYSL